MDSELCEKREDKLCKGDYKYTPFAKSVLALLTENRRKFPPPSPFVCFQQFSVALISIKKILDRMAEDIATILCK